MKLTVSKTSIVRYEAEKDGKKNPPKYLWALIDEYNHTFIQIYSEEYPTKFIKLFE